MKPQGEWICWTDSTCQCSALHAFNNHCRINTDIPAHVPLFAFETTSSDWAPMKGEWFMARCNEAWASSFPNKLTGHSFRIGGTTHLLLLGLDPFIVMVQGRWKSDAFLSYWKHCEQILLLFIGSAFKTPESILSTMTAFKRKLTSHAVSGPGVFLEKKEKKERWMGSWTKLTVCLDNGKWLRPKFHM